MTFQSTPERLAIRNRLVGLFQQVPAEGLVTHDQIARAIGPRVSAPSALKHSAFKVCTDEYGIAFENVRSIGYRRLAPADLSRVGATVRHSIRGKARRGVSKIEAVLSANSNSMSNTEKLAAYTESSLLGMIQASAGHHAARKAHAAADAATQNTWPDRGDIAKSILAGFSAKAA